METYIEGICKKNKLHHLLQPWHYLNLLNLLKENHRAKYMSKEGRDRGRGDPYLQVILYPDESDPATYIQSRNRILAHCSLQLHRTGFLCFNWYYNPSGAKLSDRWAVCMSWSSDTGMLPQRPEEKLHSWDKTGSGPCLGHTFFFQEKKGKEQWYCLLDPLWREKISPKR